MKITEHPDVKASDPHIIVGYCRRTRLPLRPMALLTKGDTWSHCGVYHPEYGVIEALTKPGVVPTPLDEWVATYPVFVFLRIAVPDPAAALAFAVDQIGTPYDFGGAFGAFLEPWRTDWHNPNAWYCSELVEAVIEAGGRRRFREEKGSIRPMESYNAPQGYGFVQPWSFA